MSEISERVARVQTVYPAYTRNLDSATRNRETGVTLTAEAKALAYPQKVKVSAKYLNKAFRVNRNYWNEENFQKNLKICGYETGAAWLRTCYKRLEAESAARQKKTVRDKRETA